MVKILDFGLAKQAPALLAASSSDGPTRSIVTAGETLSHPGLLVGTLEYMAPEQVKGEPTDARADLFSFGVTLYIMASGRSPFAGATAPVILGAILHESPAPPSVRAANLPREFDAIVMKALEKEPDARYQGASELRADLVRLKSRVEGRASFRPGRVWAALAVLLLLVCAAVLLVRRNERGSNGPAPAQSGLHLRRTLAVLGFKNLTGRRDIDWMSVALSEMMSTELAAGDTLRIIPGENVALAKVGFSLADAESYNGTTLAQLKKRLGTDLVVLGSYIDLGPDSGKRMRVDVRLQDTARGETLLAVSRTAAESDLFELVSEIGAALRDRLGAGSVPASAVEGVRASLPSNPDVTRLYAEGLKALRVYDFQSALNLFDKVVTAEPGYAPGHSALARAYAALGYDATAAAEAKRAFDLATGLSREDRLAIEARYRETAHDWGKAIEAYESLWQSFPDNIEYGLQLARAQTAGGKGRLALETVKTLRALPSPSRDDPRIELADAGALESLGDFDQVARVLRTILAAKGESPLILARAHQLEGWALHRVGKSQEGLAELKQAELLYNDSGQMQGVARVMESTGNILYSLGDFARARQLNQQALAVYRKIGDREGTANALNGIANAYYTNGDFQEAKPLYQESLDIERELGSTNGLAGALGNMANVLDSEGDLAGAGKMQEESLEAFRKVGDERGASTTLANIGNLLLEEGDLAGARKAQEQSLAESTRINFKSGNGYSLQGLGEVLLAQGDLAGARQRLEESANLRRGLGEQDMVANVSADLANLALREGSPQKAEQLARAAVAEFEKVKDPENEAVGTSILSDALLAQGKVGQAQAASDRARTIIPRSATFPSRFQLGIVAARVHAATGDSRRAKQELNDVIGTAKRHGYLGSEFEARLTLGKIQMKTGDGAAGRTALKSLEREAGDKGFLLIARAAQAASR